MIRFYILFSQGFIARVVLSIFLISVSMLFFSFKSQASTSAVQTDPYLRLTVTGNVYSDESVIRYNSAATNNFDSDYDAYKFMNKGTTPSLYTTIGTVVYSINSLSEPSAEPVMPVCLKILENGIYSLKIENNTVSNYVLLDKKLNTQTLIDGSAYTFVASLFDNVNRFELRLEVMPSLTMAITPLNQSSGLQIYSTLGGVLIHSDQFEGNNCDVELLNETGLLLKTIHMQISTTGTDFIELSDMVSGLYLIKVTINENSFMEQVMLLNR
jgi:hypothetical protein